jgi:hypothetical protein
MEKAEIWFEDLPLNMHRFSRYYLVDPATREKLTSGFHQITEDGNGNFVGYYHGVRSRKEILDPYTGEPLERFYHEEYERDGFRLGRVSACEYILDPETGKRMSSGYNKIYFQENLLFGELGSLKYILNQNNKRRLSQGYQEIYIDEQGLLIGELSSERYQIDPVSGKQIAKLEWRLPHLQ